jgi:hypothetical protein
MLRVVKTRTGQTIHLATDDDSARTLCGRVAYWLGPDYGDRPSVLESVTAGAETLCDRCNQLSGGEDQGLTELLRRVCAAARAGSLSGAQVLQLMEAIRPPQGETDSATRA